MDFPLHELMDEQACYERLVARSTPADWPAPTAGPPIVSASTAGVAIR